MTFSVDNILFLLDIQTVQISRKHVVCILHICRWRKHGLYRMDCCLKGRFCHQRGILQKHQKSKLRWNDEFDQKIFNIFWLRRSDLNFLLVHLVKVCLKYLLASYMLAQFNFICTYYGTICFLSCDCQWWFREQGQPNMPVLFSLNHPLDEIAPVICRTGGMLAVYHSLLHAFVLI